MGKKRRKFDNKFKAMIAIEAIKKEKTLAELTSEYGVHANQIVTWKKKLLAEVPGIFERKNAEKNSDAQKREDELLRQIGQLTVELNWLKKKSDLFS